MWLVHIRNFDTWAPRPGLATRGVMVMAVVMAAVMVVVVAVVMVVVVVMMVGVIALLMVVLAMNEQASFRSPRCFCGYYW